MSRRRSTPPVYTPRSTPTPHHATPRSRTEPWPHYPRNYSRQDIERIANRLAMNWDQRRGVRLGPEVAKLCEDGLRMLLSEPSRERLMAVLCGRLNCPDKDNCDPCTDKAREIVRMYQDERRKDWSL